MNVKTIVEMVPPVIVTGVGEVSVSLGPRLFPVQNGVGLPSRLALSRTRPLSFPI